MTARPILTTLLLTMAVSAALCTALPLRAGAVQQPLVVTEDLAPYNYQQGRELKGPCNEIVLEILRRTGSGIPQGVRVLPWSRAYALARQVPNVALYSTVRNPEREHLFHWVGPIYHDELVMMRRKGSKVTARNLEEAKKYTIGVMQDYAGEDLLRKNNFPQVHSLPGAPEQMIYMLAHDRVDLWLESWPSGMYYAARAGKPAGWIEPLFTVTREDLYVAFSLFSDQEMIRRWSDALQDMHDDGTYDKLINRFEERLANNRLQ
ncbi:MAG: substrate-binding periplasmic protein [Halodesulfovibrio sp.]